MHADWAQVVVSGVAILASGGIAVWVPHRQRKAEEKARARARLEIATRRFEPTGLQLAISYTPEFRHESLLAKVTLLGPLSAKLKALRWAKNAAQVNGEFAREEMSGDFLDGEGTIRLIERARGEPFRGGFLILRADIKPEPIARSRLKVEILTTSNQVLVSDTITASPIDELDLF